jgi:hypothetical protein
MTKKVHDAHSDPIFEVLNERKEAHLQVMAAVKRLDKCVMEVDSATDGLAVKERQLLATQPITSAGAVALLDYLAEILTPFDEVALIAIPALTNIRIAIAEISRPQLI